MLISKYNQNGAVIATIISEAFVVIIIFILEKKELKKINFITINTIKIIGISFYTIIIIEYLKINISSSSLLTLFFMKEKVLTDGFKIIKLKLK